MIKTKKREDKVATTKKKRVKVKIKDKRQRKMEREREEMDVNQYPTSINKVSSIISHVNDEKEKYHT